MRRLRSGDRVLDKILGRVGVVQSADVAEYAVRSEYTGATWSAARWDLELLPPLRVGSSPVQPRRYSAPPRPSGLRP
ncbi:hypothetical protein ABT160_02785 [Streptomyces sp. NPDC001941]|uniref:hypothetical protein n=1 Tax=Streptomyces sp. NPDC001941 TaxID=3154659 RepID=UPI00333259C2